jgi:ribonuclease HII
MSAKTNAKYLASLLALFNSSPGRYIIGVDEVARGCLAGPVVACAVCLDKEAVLSQLPGLKLKIDDSKKLKPSQRVEAERWIKGVSHAGVCRAWAVGSASVAEIAELNIRRATFLAMNRAIADVLSQLSQYRTSGVEGGILADITIDGNAFEVMPGFDFGPGIELKTLVRGDATHFAIACASIIAKETRDRWLDELVIAEPGLAVYNWGQNRAYGTPEHFRLLREHGASPHHRLDFLKKQGLG